MPIRAGGLAGPRTVLNAEHEMFRDAVRRFFERHVVPHHRQWERDGIVPRALWLEAGAQGLLCPMLAEEYGGAGGDFGYSRRHHRGDRADQCTGVGFPLHSDIVVPYIADLATAGAQARMAAADGAAARSSAPSP